MARQRTLVDDFLDALKDATVEFVSARLVDLPPIGHTKPPREPRARRKTIKPPKVKTPKAPKAAKREAQGPTLYQVLGVDAKAEPEVIEAAWKAKARLYHPDKNKSPRSGSMMQGVNNAHDVLSDPEKRKAYDMLLREAR